MTNFSDRLHELRILNNIKQSEISSLLGITDRQVRKYEYGDAVNPKMDTLIALADFFNVSLDYLVGRSDEK